jgi:hypothetical protein
MLTKQQAADFLGVNVRTLERYTQEGKIGSRYEKGKTRSVVVYDEEELKAFKAAQETKTYKPAVDPTPTNPDSNETALSKFVEVSQQLHLMEGLNNLADVLKAIREEQEIDRQSVPIHHKLTLSLASLAPWLDFPASDFAQPLRMGHLPHRLLVGATV